MDAFHVKCQPHILKICGNDSISTVEVPRRTRSSTPANRLDRQMHDATVYLDEDTPAHQARHLAGTTS